ncbi:MAG TPA: multicopper oxidase domain-containing protein [Candidatus Elarobacter sp.]|nr:multicopper oxidase domain-containing protein [Candidatus Elarobacter sp.]
MNGVRLITSAAAVAAFAALLVGCAHATAAVSSTVPAPDVFPAIPEVRAQHGVARVELHVVLDPVSGYPAFSWNARLGVVPTIRVRPGDAIDMIVHNDMRPFAGRPDDVNVHFHGLTVSPNAPADDSMKLARPGQTLHYRVAIPRDHEPGLYWYHPHAHGETYYEVTNGMSGAIVVEGIERHLPALAAMRERIVVLRDVPTGAGFVDNDMPVTGMAGMNMTAVIPRSRPGPACRAENGLQPTLNRQPDAHIGIRPGERQFFRVVNASAARYYDLSVDGAALQLVGVDGVPLDAYPGTAAVRMVRHVLVPPAGRAEFVVTAPAHATVLRSSCVDTGPQGDANPAIVLAHLVDPSNGAAPAPPADAELRVGAPLPPNVLSRPAPAPAARRTIRFTEDARGFYINGKAFDMNGPPAIVARSGTVEEWTVENATDESHDFHIHQVHFYAVALNGQPAGTREWRDTIDVPRQRHDGSGRTSPGRVRLIMDFRDPVVRGTFMYHCHILDHEDRGMMAKIRVI